jgi:hypothetical protein
MAAPEFGPKVDGWEPTHLQLIAFSVIPASDIKQSWWQDLTGAEPEEAIRKRNERTDRGKFQGRSLILATDILRINWTVAPHIEPEDFLENILPTLGPMEESCDWFANLMQGWLRENPPALKRLAFVAKFIRRVEDNVSAYRLLKQILNLDLDDESADLIYRINRKRLSQTGIADLTINRVVTWSAIRALAQAQVLGTEGSQQISPAFACSIDVDINTSHEFNGEIPQIRLPELFRELVELGIEVVKRGDVR